MLEIPEVRARNSRDKVAQYHQFSEFKLNDHCSELIRNGFLKRPPAAKTTAR